MVVKISTPFMWYYTWNITARFVWNRSSLPCPHKFFTVTYSETDAFILHPHILEFIAEHSSSLHKLQVFQVVYLFFFNLHSGWWSPNWAHSARRPFTGLLYLPRVIVRMERIWWNEWQGKSKYSEKTYPGATLSTTNPTWPDPGLNPGRRGGKPATNRFSYGAAKWFITFRVSS
jgi:hypothetical protein